MHLAKKSIRNLSGHFMEWISSIKSAVYRIIPTSIYIRLMYYHKTGIKLNLKNPQTFCEKLQWMKLHYRNPVYSYCADKLKVREYIAKTVGEQYLVPLLGVYDSADDIDFEKLPDRFVFKCNHDSGSVIFCKDKNNFDIKQAKEKLTKHMNTNYYYPSREWQYKDIAPKILCEEYMTDAVHSEIRDYKIFCFSGEPKIIQVICDKYTDMKLKFYYTDWEPIENTISKHPEPSITIQKPDNLDEMLDIASKLSKGFPHVRIDLHLSHNRIYFGEITFFDLGGSRNFKSMEFNLKMGSWLNLPEKNYSFFGGMK